MDDSEQEQPQRPHKQKQSEQQKKPQQQKRQEGPHQEQQSTPAVSTRLSIPGDE